MREILNRIWYAYTIAATVIGTIMLLAGLIIVTIIGIAEGFALYPRITSAILAFVLFSICAWCADHERQSQKKIHQTCKRIVCR